MTLDWPRAANAGPRKRKPSENDMLLFLKELPSTCSLAVPVAVSPGLPSDRSSVRAAQKLSQNMLLTTCNVALSTNTPAAAFLSICAPSMRKLLLPTMHKICWLLFRRSPVIMGLTKVAWVLRHSVSRQLPGGLPQSSALHLTPGAAPIAARSKGSAAILTPSPVQDRLALDMVLLVVLPTMVSWH